MNKEKKKQKKKKLNPRITLRVISRLKLKNNKSFKEIIFIILLSGMLS